MTYRARCAGARLQRARVARRGAGVRVFFGALELDWSNITITAEPPTERERANREVRLTVSVATRRVPFLLGAQIIAIGSPWPAGDIKVSTLDESAPVAAGWTRK